MYRKSWRYIINAAGSLINSPTLRLSLRGNGRGWLKSLDDLLAVETRVYLRRYDLITRMTRPEFHIGFTEKSFDMRCHSQYVHRGEFESSTIQFSIRLTDTFLSTSIPWLETRRDLATNTKRSRIQSRE